jgi:hypothetical protein
MQYFKITLILQVLPFRMILTLNLWSWLQQLLVHTLGFNGLYPLKPEMSANALSPEETGNTRQHVLNLKSVKLRVYCTIIPPTETPNITNNELQKYYLGFSWW